MVVCKDRAKEESGVTAKHMGGKAEADTSAIRMDG
jgi:hypothetical protein